MKNRKSNDAAVRKFAGRKTRMLKQWDALVQELLSGNERTHKEVKIKLPQH